MPADRMHQSFMMKADILSATKGIPMMTRWFLAATLQLVGTTPYVQPFVVTQAQPDMPRIVDTEVQKDPADTEQPILKWNELRAEYDRLQLKAEDLQRQLEKAQQDLAGGKKALGDVNARLAVLEKEKSQMAGALTEARDQARDLSTKLAAEQVKAATLREDKQRLMSGTTTTKEEIARLQKHAAELETEAARAEDLAKRLAERDQEIERLRKSVADRESLANKVTGLTDKLERAKQQVTSLTDELIARNEEAARVRQERDQLIMEIQKRQEGLKGSDSSAVHNHSIEKAPEDRAKLNIGPLDGALLHELRKPFPGIR
jgi:chromosome segregation ATPase